MRARKFLESVQVTDPLERSNAPAVQVVLLLLGVLVPLVWIFGRAEAGDTKLVTRWLIPATALVSLWLLRRGNFRGAVGLVLSAFVAHFSATLVVLGLQSRGTMLPGILFMLVFAGLVVSRRVLWILFASITTAMIVGSLREIPEVWPTAAVALHPGRNTLLSNFLFSTLFLTVILDRFGTALRSTYRKAVDQAAELAEAHRIAQDAEARFRVALEGSLDSFVVWRAVRDGQGTIVDFQVVDANERAARLTGTTRETAIGTRLSDVAPATFEKGGSFERFVRVADTRVTSEEEFAPTALAGVTWVRQQLVPVNDGVAAIIRDLSSQRAIEAEIGSLRDQFLQSQKMEVVGVLASSVAHDFNNVLTVIGGHIEVLGSERLTAEGREAVEQISNASGRAASLTKTLLTFGRRQGHTDHVTRLRDIVRHSRAAWERLLGAQVALVVEAGDDYPARVNAGEFEQVVLNLLVNARDAIPDGGRITLRTGTARFDVPTVVDDQTIGVGTWVSLEVSDTGFGIPTEHLQRIFEPFFTTKPAGRGTGLGLSTVKRLVSEHDGVITTSSRPGTGTTFRVFWPAESAGAGVSVATPTPVAMRGTERVLVVDDDAAVQRVFETGLSALGYIVTVAGTGQRAIELVERSPVDVLVTDVVLPSMGGPDIAVRIRARLPGIPVIFVSGLADPGLELGPGQYFLQKPITPRALAEQVRIALGEAAIRTVR